MSRKTLSSLLLAVAILLAALAVATLIPYPDAPILSDLGYSSFCPFAPWSTLALLFLAGVSWVVRGHINKQPA